MTEDSHIQSTEERAGSRLRQISFIFFSFFLFFMFCLWTISLFVRLCFSILFRFGTCTGRKRHVHHRFSRNLASIRLVYFTHSLLFSLLAFRIYKSQNRFRNSRILRGEGCDDRPAEQKCPVRH